MPIVNSFWGTLPRADIEEFVSSVAFQQTLEFAEANAPYRPGWGAMWAVPGDMAARLSHAEIAQIAAQVRAMLPALLAGSDRRPATQEELDDAERVTRGRLAGWNVAVSVDGPAVVGGASNSGLFVDVQHDAAFMLVNGRVDTALFALNANPVDKDTAKGLLIVDILIECLGGLLAALGFWVPKADIVKLLTKIKSKLSNPAVNAGIQALLSAIKAGSASGVINALATLSNAGLLAMVMGEWLDTLDFWDYLQILGAMLAFILSIAASGGATAVAKASAALASLLAIATKCEELDQLLSA